MAEFMVDRETEKTGERKTVKPDVYNLPKRENIIMLPNPLQKQLWCPGGLSTSHSPAKDVVHVYHYLTKVI